MYAPSNVTIAGTISSISTVDLSLHALLNLSWMILLPYTLLGIGLMVYSQSRLAHGERKLKHEESL